MYQNVSFVADVRAAVNSIEVSVSVLGNAARGFFDLQHTGRFIMFSAITNIYNKKTKGPTVMELFTATGKLNNFFYS
jgi:hypothetical protein